MNDLAEMGRSVLRPYKSERNPGTGLNTGHYRRPETQEKTSGLKA
ncbi:MAG TPA: hypothetical protein VJY15_13570 [Candidatus Acidoferrum sp.]|nr:hypothetical protein [Candidatus Acidoferrum sp.]